MSNEDYNVYFYGAASSICKDLMEYYKRTEKDLSSLHIWRTTLCETVVVLLDYKPFNPPVGSVVRIWERCVEEGSQLYYWREIDVSPHWKGYHTDLMIEQPPDNPVKGRK